MRSDTDKLLDGWEWKELNDICIEDKVIIDGKDSSLPSVGLEMIKSGTGEIDFELQTMDGISNCYYFDDRHILYGKLRPYLNKVAIPNLKGRCSTELVPLFPKEGIYREFLALILKRKETIEYVMKEKTGSRMPRANVKYLLTMEVPVPPIQEQIRIVKTIETKLNAIEKINKASNEQIKAFQFLKEKLYDGVFEEYIKDQVTIDSICDDISDGTHFTPTYIDKGIPFLSVKDLTKGFISFDDCRYITVEEHKKLIKRCNPQYGDVLYTKVGTTGIAKAIDVKTEFSIFVSVALLKLKKDISPIFIEKVLNLPFCRKQAEKINQGATNKNLVIKDLKKIKLFCPDYSEQQKIVSILKKIDDKLNLLNKSFKEQSSYIDALPSSILRKAFNGDY
jgi:type I restriction enzyme S subunit